MITSRLNGSILALIQMGFGKGGGGVSFCIEGLKKRRVIGGSSSPITNIVVRSIIFSRVNITELLYRSYYKKFLCRKSNS